MLYKGIEKKYAPLCSPWNVEDFHGEHRGDTADYCMLSQSSRNIPAYGRTIQLSPGKNILMAVAVVMSSAVALSTP